MHRTFKLLFRPRVVTRLNQQHTSAASITKDRYGNLYKLNLEDCSENQHDWKEFMKLCTQCFYNDPCIKEDLPDETTRAEHMNTFNKWEFKNLGLNAAGPGRLVCVKGIPKAHRGDPKVVFASCATPLIEEVSIDFSRLYLPKNEFINAKRRMTFEYGLLNLGLKCANSIDAVLYYGLHRVMHPDFQGMGLGRKYLPNILDGLTKGTDFTHCWDDEAIPAIFVTTCTNKFARDSLINAVGGHTVGHLHYPKRVETIICSETQSQTCYYVVLVKPNNELLSQKMKKQFL